MIISSVNLALYRLASALLIAAFVTSLDMRGELSPALFYVSLFYLHNVQDGGAK